jgi:putative ABC transport system substrate-binding protein
LFNPEVAPFAGEFFRHAEAAAGRLGIELTAAAVHDDGEIEETVAALASEPNGGLVVINDLFIVLHRKRIIALAAQYRLPVVYPFRYYVTDGGLISYGTDPIDAFRAPSSYVDRILRGDKPADLPVQAPAKFEIVVNLKTARAIGLDVPPEVLALAATVIE